MSQTSIGAQQEIIAGVYEPLVPHEIFTRANEGPASVPIGALVVAGSTDEFAVLPVDGLGRIEGVVIHSHLYARSEFDSVGLVAKASMDILREGVVALQFEDAVSAGGVVRVRKPAPAWQATTAYGIGDRVTNDGKLYECTIAGTSAGSGGPTHTSGTAVDGTVTWLFLNFGTSSGQIGELRTGAITDETVPVNGLSLNESVTAGGVGWVTVTQLSFGTPD